ncbi:MAG: His-Xaa-Ser system radical SAM maturase HxsC [Azoarcus sp.]|jgi:His-Xaa-Ser system radical SAM maturase HxsC|nr:His-Xaa-Ser system radical SAM maturase HxsC [Azoarcus sp.]
MEYTIPLHRIAAKAQGITERFLARVAYPGTPITPGVRTVLSLHSGNDGLHLSDLQGYAAILQSPDTLDNIDSVPLLLGVPNLSTISEGSIVAISPTGRIHTLYRPESRFNTIFATGQCNSNCLMCSQPPTDDHIPSLVKEHHELLSLIREPPSHLGISGGEPTLLGDGLVDILSAISGRFPDTPVTMLTNGRRFQDIVFTRSLAESAPKEFLTAIPLYADTPSLHDWIVQIRGAFQQTVFGLYNAARSGLTVEIRVVLHKLSIPRLVHLMNFIYRNFPFVCHVALMGLEHMGYVKKNWELLWIDPVDYQKELIEAAKHLHYRGVPFSIYNLPLCIVPPELRSFARQSISDYKNIYVGTCDSCTVRTECSGLFASSKERHSRGIQAIT